VTAVPFGDIMEALDVSGATYMVRSGCVLDATFPRPEQRDGFAARFTSATVHVAGQQITLDHARTWIDEHGYGLVLAPGKAQLAHATITSV
jgi:hypothetical protein